MSVVRGTSVETRGECGWVLCNKDNNSAFTSWNGGTCRGESVELSGPFAETLGAIRGMFPLNVLRLFRVHVRTPMFVCRLHPICYV